MKALFFINRPNDYNVGKYNTNISYMQIYIKLFLVR